MYFFLCIYLISKLSIKEVRLIFRYESIQGTDKLKSWTIRNKFKVVAKRTSGIEEECVCPYKLMNSQISLFLGVNSFKIFEEATTL